MNSEHNAVVKVVCKIALGNQSAMLILSSSVQTTIISCVRIFLRLHHTSSKRPIHHKINWVLYCRNVYGIGSDPTWVMAFSFLLVDHTQRHITVDRTPLDEWSFRRRDIYLTTQQTSTPPVGFEPTISAGERPKTYALDRAAAGTGILCQYPIKFQDGSCTM